MLAQYPGARRFQVLRPLARGGLGEVLVARDEELHREVALKLIQERHAGDPGSRTRFQFEAEITGRLEHPGVIPVYGLGVDERGRPYYAMRLVRGESLKESIARFHGEDGPTRDPGERSLAFRELVGRFVDVCNTIAYAHGRGILHRDLKPANIMLGPYGETLVVDWGLAKAAGRTDGDPAAMDESLELLGASDGAATEPGSWLGTPAFMSPEQAAGRIDLLAPASDIYSLGATLYNLLTGKNAFEGPAVQTLLGKIQAGDFPPPRSVDATIEPALEAVCIKAMALIPGDRYASCRALADDLERWAADEPVSAYRDPAPIRLGRWCRRHRPLVVGLTATASVAVVAMAIGTVLIGRQRSEAVRQRDRAADNLAMARQVVDEMYTRAASLLADRNGMDADRRDLLLKAARFYERFALPQSTDPAVRIEAGRAILRAANILWKLGDTEQAEADYGKALELLEAMVAAAPYDAESRHVLADGCLDVSEFYRDMGRLAEAEANSRRSAELYERLAAADPRAAADRRGTAISLIELGNIESDLGRYPDAESSIKQAVVLLEELVRDHSGVAEYRGDQARAWNSLADLERRLGRTVDAMTSWGRALAACEGLTRAHPDIERYRAAAARTAHNLGTVQSEVGREVEAIASYKKAAELREALVSDHPDVPVYRYELSGTYNNRGNLLRDTGKPAEAQHAYEQAIAMRDRLVLDHPSVASYRGGLALSLRNLGMVLQQIGSPSSALPTFQRSVVLQEDLVRDHPDAVEYRVELATVLVGLASTQRLAGKRDEAMQSLRRSVELWESLPVAQPQHLYNLACAHAQYYGLIDGRRQPLLPKEKAERESHAERSILALRRAVASGIIPPAWVSQDPDFDPLRSRGDFRALLMDLTFPAQPFASPPAMP